MMNLFENLQNMKENVLKLSNKELIKKYVNKLSDEEKEEYDVKNILANIDSLSEDDNTIEDLAIVIQDVLLDNEVDIEPATDGTSDWFIYNESVLKEYKSNINNKIELWHEMFRYTDEPFVLFKDLFNCYSIDDLQDLYDYLSSEYRDKEFIPYKGKLNSIDELWDEMNKLVPNEKVAFNDLFNCYSLDKLKDLYDFLSSEYFDIDDLEESTKLEEASTNKSGYTLNFGAWRTGNGMSFGSKNELVSFLRSNYIDLETVITYCENVTNDFKNSMHKIDNSFIKDKDTQKKFFDKGYVKIVDVKNDDLEESVKLEKLSIGNKLQAIFDKFDNNAKLIGFMLQFIDEDIIEKMYNEIVSVEESTSGIGGAYTTKAIDIKPE
nr:MAG TPA: hypothetical protein [Caudoviricetes sp.]